MITLVDFEDVWLGAMANQERWEMEFNAAFIEPIANDMVAKALASMTPEQRDYLQNSNPQMWDQISKRIGGKHANTTARGNVGKTDFRY